MRKVVIALALAAVIGGAAVWYFLVGRESPRLQRAEDRLTAVAGRTLDSAQTAAGHITQALMAKLESFELRPDDIKRDLAATGKIVRRRARDLGEEVADATADARVTAAIKARLAADPELSTLSISVDTTAGRVTLAGAVASPNLIGKAMVLALETDGVREVISTLQVR